MLFDILLNRLIDICPASRELSIVKTKLEEASFLLRKQWQMYYRIKNS